MPAPQSSSARSVHEIAPPDHAFAKVDDLAIDAEAPVALMVNQPLFAARGINPDPLHFQHDHVVAVQPA